MADSVSQKLESNQLQNFQNEEYARKRCAESPLAKLATQSREIRVTVNDKSEMKGT